MSLLLAKKIETKIHLIRAHRVILDKNLATLYGVTTSNLNKAVSRNLDRFPGDFMFQLTKNEANSLRFQSGTLKRGQHAKYLPRAFTEQGVAMLSSVLRSKRAIHVNIEIMRVFTKIRKMLMEHGDLRRKIEHIEQKYDKQFRVVFEAIKQLLEPPPPPEKPKKRIGFHPNTY